MEKEFKLNDVVYWGTLKGKVKVADVSKKYALSVDFDGLYSAFTADGRICDNLPVVLSHYPYEWKEIEPIIEKDTLVYVRNDMSTEWKMRYYSNFEDNMHWCFERQQASKETGFTSSWKYLELTNPLIK